MRSMTDEGRRDLAEIFPMNPHPTSLREATFSHEWEKDALPNTPPPKKPKSPIMPHVFTTARLFRARF